MWTPDLAMIRREADKSLFNNSLMQRQAFQALTCQLSLKADPQNQGIHEHSCRSRSSWPKTVHGKG